MCTMQNSRRRFFKNAATGALTLGLSPALVPGELMAMAGNTPDDKRIDLFRVGIAGWSFQKIALDISLEMMNRVDVRHLCIKDFHLPLNSTDEHIAAFKNKLKAKGVTGFGVGPIYMTSKNEVDHAFEYAKRVGVRVLVGVPEHGLLPYVGEKVKEYDMHFAIHNHGRKDKRYPSVPVIHDFIKDLDPRVGICHDIGYSMEMGLQPADLMMKYGKRVYEMHIKDMTKHSGEWTECEVGRGEIDFPALAKALRKIRYSWTCSIEYDKNSTDPLPGIAESVGHFKAVLNVVK